MGTEYKASFTPLDIWSHRVLPRNPRERSSLKLANEQRRETTDDEQDLRRRVFSPLVSSILVEIFPIVAALLVVFVVVVRQSGRDITAPDSTR